MSFTQFIKPYPNGYIDGEAGDTPVTAEILNTNYDGFLLALNSWASDVENDIGDAKSDITGLQGNISNIQSALNNKVDTSTFNQLGETVRQIGIAVNGKSTVSISDLLQSGTKVATLTIDGTQYDLYAPSGGGGGSSVSWNQIISTGTKIATVTIDGVPTDVYVPTPIDELSNLTDVSITNLQNGQILKWNSTTLKWENSNESGGGGTGGHTIIDENGNSMTARAGLQFVGGANVSDDATNNKTIVDLASAGGIDGVFVDVNNRITGGVINSGSVTHSEFEYTATEDCYFTIYSGKTSSAVLRYLIDGAYVGVLGTGTSYDNYQTYFSIKKGQTIKITGLGAYAGYTVYGIQTGTTHSKFQPVIYSLEEREIGVWTDGRPLYEKTIDFGAIPNSTSKNVAHNISNLDKVVSFDGVMISSDSFETVPSGENSNFRLTATDTNVNVVTSANWNDWSSSFITLRYTKSSDTAGSGSWTPQGVPTHHYSTDEQIIGTWIDGKTLYEKTISSDLTLSTESWQNYTSLANLNLLSVDKVIITRDGEQVPMAFSPYMIVAWIVRDNYLKFIIQSSSVAETIVLKSCTIQYTKSS